MRGFDLLRRVLRSGGFLGVGFIALSFFIASAVIFSVGQQSSDAVVRRALQIEVDFADVFSSLQDAEIGQRGYLLTGDDAFLAPYRVASRRLATQLDTLGQSIANIEGLRAPFAALRALAAEKQSELAQTLTLYQSGRRAEALAFVGAGSGKALMDQIRTRIDALDAREDSIVTRREASLQRTGALVAASITAAVILLGGVALAAMREVRRRAQLSRFLPAEIAPRLAAEDGALQRGREVAAAIVFVDIRRSTALAESLPPTALSRLLSSFRGAVSATARETGGFVDKFVGDGALIVFGALDDDPDACAKALAFAHALKPRVEQSQASGQVAALRIGIGIHYGPVFCGIVGDDDRLEFTVLGDTVNVASRIEGLTKTERGATLVSETVLLAAHEPLTRWIKVSDQPLRGRTEPLAIYKSAADGAS